MKDGRGGSAAAQAACPSSRTKSTDALAALSPDPEDHVEFGDSV